MLAWNGRVHPTIQLAEKCDHAPPPCLGYPHQSASPSLLSYQPLESQLSPNPATATFHHRCGQSTMPDSDISMWVIVTYFSDCVLLILPPSPLSDLSKFHSYLHINSDNFPDVLATHVDTQFHNIWLSSTGALIHLTPTSICSTHV